MSLIDHPNAIKAHCSFVVDHNLWVVMPFMAEGSCLHLMKIHYPDGFDEPAICSILKETLKALDYLHQQGHIHRDVKAGNILLDSNGVVKLADFGVSACMFETGDRQRSRNTFVGTPCWMAPEVLQPGSGYNSKADIWSFGITALELAHGHAPFSKYPPMKVLLMTIQNAPPGLDYDRDKKFSKLFKEMIAMCLVKDQMKRPTAEQLLKHSFFKNAKPPEHSVKNLFTDLPPLWQRVKAIQLKDAAQLALKKMPSAEQEALSQSEYQRGVSAWNFDIDDLKAQALLLRDDDDIQEGKDENDSNKTTTSSKDIDEHKSSTDSDILPVEGQGNTNQDEFSSSDSLKGKGKIAGSIIVEPSGQEKLNFKTNGINNDIVPHVIEKDRQAKIKAPVRSRQTQSGPLVPNAVLGHSPPERWYTSDRGDNENVAASEKPKIEVRKAPSFSGPLMLPNRASANSLSAPIKSSGGFRDSLDEKSKANLVQIKGRFSVTSENLDLVKVWISCNCMFIKCIIAANLLYILQDIPLTSVPRRSQGSPLRKSASVGEWVFEPKQVPTNHPIKDFGSTCLPASAIMPHLQNLLQQTSLQQELIASLLNSLPPNEADATQNGKLIPLPHGSEMNGIVAETPASQRERLLLSKVSELQARMMNLTFELTAEKLKYIRLQQQLNSLSGPEQNGGQREEGACICWRRYQSTTTNKYKYIIDLNLRGRCSCSNFSCLWPPWQMKLRLDLLDWSFFRFGDAMLTRAELSHDAPFAAAIGASILSSRWRIPSAQRCLISANEEQGRILLDPNKLGKEKPQGRVKAWTWVLTRNGEGMFLGGHAKEVRCNSSEEVEALVLIQGVLLAKEMQYWEFILETNSTMVEVSELLHEKLISAMFSKFGSLQKKKKKKKKKKGSLASRKGFWKQKQKRTLFNFHRHSPNLPLGFPFMAAASPTVSSPPYSTASPSNAPEVKRVGTHNGSFHCDEALGCFMIRLTSKFCNAHIVRTRDPQVLEDLDAVLDVGGIYDPIRDRYDHHQKGFEEVFGYGFSTKLSSAGLVYKSLPLPPLRNPSISVHQDGKGGLHSDGTLRSKREHGVPAGHREPKAEVDDEGGGCGMLATRKEGRGDTYLAGSTIPFDSHEELTMRGYHIVPGVVDVGMFRSVAVAEGAESSDHVDGR
ncbi:hypothetical protein SAY86_027242 [Trapa natans]|uniref:Protein kinase domain-containing protein n=1 Tax=Trapa natans TaxID=22666 RepID=A0AAN7KM29_TRANT|nr:hypothetical protein SAY86_027242 [Trapa natans]